jgi:hypothetical protein
VCDRLGSMPIPWDCPRTSAARSLSRNVCSAQRYARPRSPALRWIRLRRPRTLARCRTHGGIHGAAALFARSTHTRCVITACRHCKRSIGRDRARGIRSVCPTCRQPGLISSAGPVGCAIVWPDRILPRNHASSSLLRRELVLR